MSTTITTELLNELSQVSQRDDAGRHFTEWLDWQSLEEAGFVEIRRPVHAATGIAYDSQYWTIEMTTAGQAALEATCDDDEVEQRPLLTEFDTSKPELRPVWDALDTPIYRVLTDGANMYDAKIRRLGKTVWLYVDEQDGFDILSDEVVDRMFSLCNDCTYELVE